MKKLLLSALTATIIMGMTPAVSQATNGYQLTGIGAKQNSMGGAVTAAPMDAMTAISNPAGMARIGKRADFSMEALMPTRSVNFEATGGGSDEGGSKMYGIPSLGWTAPAFGRDDVYFGGGMYVTSGLGVDYDQTVFMPGSKLGAGMQDVTFSGYSAIQFWKMSPTVAWNVNKSLTVGASLNIDYQSVTIMEKLRNVPFWTSPAKSALAQMDVSLDLGRPTSQMGYGATVGVLYDIGKAVTIGASYSTKQNFNDAEFRVGKNEVLNYNGATGAAGTYKMGLEYPQQAAFGIAIKPSDTLLVAADVKWINWSQTHDKVDFTGPANSFDSNGDGAGDSNRTQLDFGWKDQWIYALGVQFKPTDRLSLRAGYNYAKAPIDQKDVFNNLLLPAIVEQHASVGFDYMLGDHWGLGMSLMKAFKKTMKGTGDVPAGFQAVTPFTADSNAEISLEETSVGLQLTYLF